MTDTGYLVEYRAGKTSQPQYLEGDQKTISDDGYEWATYNAAANALNHFKVIVGHKHIPCASLQVVTSKTADAYKAEQALKAEAAQAKAEAEAALLTAETPVDSDGSDVDIGAAEERIGTADDITFGDIGICPGEDAQDNPETADADAVFGELPKPSADEPVFGSILHVSTEWTELMDRVDHYQRQFNAQLSEEDKRTQDILHYIELHEIADAQAVAIVRRLAYSRQRRREAKDALQILDAIAPAKFESQAVQRILNSMDTRTYHPRVDKDLPRIIADESESADDHDQPMPSNAQTKHVGLKPQAADNVRAPVESEVSMAGLIAVQRAVLKEKSANAPAKPMGVDERAINVYIDHENGMKCKELSERYGVSPATISRDLVRGKELVEEQAGIAVDDDVFDDAYDMSEEIDASGAESRGHSNPVVDSASDKLLAQWAREHQQ